MNTPLLYWLHTIVDKSSIYRFVSNSLRKGFFRMHKALARTLFIWRECVRISLYANCVNMHRNAASPNGVSISKWHHSKGHKPPHIPNHISFFAHLFIYFNVVSIFNNINKYMVFVFISCLSRKNVSALNGINMKWSSKWNIADNKDVDSSLVSLL